MYLIFVGTIDPTQSRSDMQMKTAFVTKVTLKTEDVKPVDISIVDGPMVLVKTVELAPASMGQERATTVNFCIF